MRPTADEIRQTVVPLTGRWGVIQEFVGNLKLTSPLLLMLAINGGSYRRQNLAISRSAVTSMAAISAPL
jgi:hypothetical protein